MEKIIKTITSVGAIAKQDLFFPKRTAQKNQQEAIIFFFRFVNAEDALKAKDVKVTAFNRTLKVVQVKILTFCCQEHALYIHFDKISRKND